GPAGRLFERDFEVVPKVRAALRATAAAATTEEVSEAEDVPESAEDVLEPVENGRIEAGARAGACDAGVTEAIVQSALLAVGEHRVRFGRLLEFFLGGLVARIAIRVIFHRELAISALDLAVVRGSRHAENFVIVDAAHDDFATFTIDGLSSRSPIV